MPAEPPHIELSDGPKHVALIMDGNGRWAEARGLPRAMGHREGVQALKRTVEAAPRFGIRCLTVFGFSTENWSRPAAEASTAHNQKFMLQVAFNYGGRADIIDAVQRHAEDLRSGKTAGPLDERALGDRLSTAGAPPVDVIVRTSGEQRLSNFLLWEAAYAELVYQNVLWPDYGAEGLADVVEQYRNRDRRFGGRAVPSDRVAPALTAG